MERAGRVWNGGKWGITTSTRKSLLYTMTPHTLAVRNENSTSTYPNPLYSPVIVNETNNHYYLIYILKGESV